MSCFVALAAHEAATHEIKIYVCLLEVSIVVMSCCFCAHESVTTDFDFGEPVSLQVGLKRAIGMSVQFFVSLCLYRINVTPLDDPQSMTAVCHFYPLLLYLVLIVFGPRPYIIFFLTRIWWIILTLSFFSHIYLIVGLGDGIVIQIKLVVIRRLIKMKVCIFKRFCGQNHRSLSRCNTTITGAILSLLSAFNRIIV
jgi:hypothetical protein